MKTRYKDTETLLREKASQIADQMNQARIEKQFGNVTVLKGQLKRVQQKLKILVEKRPNKG